jgi:hypothetical protein
MVVLSQFLLVFPLLFGKVHASPLEQVETKENVVPAPPKTTQYLDLSAPDPEFTSEFVDFFTVRPEDQIPGRPTEGHIEISQLMSSLEFFVTEEQRQGELMRGSSIYREIKEHNLPVLGPNVGQFLYEHQDIIPTELRYKVEFMFWGKVYRANNENPVVRGLRWSGSENMWVWSWRVVKAGYWRIENHAVLLKK